MVYGNIYSIPENIGEYNIATFGLILLHLRDPFLALHCVSRHVKDCIVVVERNVPPLKGELAHFLPNASLSHPYETWWTLSPDLIREYLKILGFEYVEVTYHKQIFFGKEINLYTCAGYRKKYYDLSLEDGFDKYKNMPVTGGGIAWLDSLNNIEPLYIDNIRTVDISDNKDSLISMRGWAYIDTKTKIDETLFVQLVNINSENDIHYEIPAVRFRRDEMARDLDNSDLKNSGFLMPYIERSKIKKGRYYIFVLQLKDKSFIKSTTGVILVL